MDHDESKCEEKVIKLAGLNSYFEQRLSGSPSQKTNIHALNHFIHSYKNLTVTKLNHALVLLSLERVLLKTASSPPEHNYSSPSISALLFDHPFDLEVVSKETCLVPVSECSSISTTNPPPQKPSSYGLLLENPYRSLENYSVLEVFETNGLLQKLISLQYTHPYIELFQHQHSESLVLVVHAGFNGSPLHQHKLSKHIHTKVGFQNFLQYVAERYSHLIDEAVEEDEIKRKVYEEERRAIIAQRLKEAEERQQEVLTPVEEEQGAEVGRSKKRSATVAKPSLKKSIISTTNTTPMSSNQELHATEMPFEKEKRFRGYDMNDTVLLKESVHATLFTGDGVQVQSRRHIPIGEAPIPSEVCLLHSDNRVVCTQVWSPANTTDNKSVDADHEVSTIPPPDSGVPQPPPQLKHASLHACFNNSLQISFSHFGSQGNGELPFLPQRPKILLHSPQSDQLQLPITQQGISPKMSKKQQEHQQQLLEQQRVLEAHLEKERQAAQVKYEQEYSALIRNNRHQQLFLSTKFGLEVKCQVIVNLSTDAEGVEISEGFVAIKQNYSSPQVAHLNEFVIKEKCRHYLPGGYVVKCMRDGSAVILCADGTKYCTASHKQVEFFNKHKAEAEKASRPQSRENDTVEKSTKRLPSGKGKMVIDSIEKMSLLDEKQKVWVMTTPAGHCYLVEQENKVKKDVPEQESNTDPANKENIEPTPSPTDDTKPSSRSVELDPVHLIKATDPITKEV